MAEAFRAALSQETSLPIIPWAERYAKLIGSARSESFRSSITPWTRLPLEWATRNSTRTLTFVKPVQSGGSVVGEVLLLYWIATSSGGDIVNYWPNDEKVQDRFKKRVQRILEACGEIQKRIPLDGLQITKAGLVRLRNLNLAFLGAFSQSNVESDSYKREINEEIHDNANNRGWLPGRLQQAYNRTTAFWDSIVVNISNASCKGDQLHQAFEAGTKQLWQVKCPGCGLFHPMRTRWDDKRPDLGGLRYDSKESKREDGSYNYNRLASTIVYQMPCGYQVHEDPTERRALSLSGEYSEPTNTGAHLSNISATLEGVSVDYIPWLKLIQEKHAALKALRYGDITPWIRYIQERECGFWDSSERPLSGKVQTVSTLRKNREGLRGHPQFAVRFFALDRQQGSMQRGELPHWWLVIRDALATGASRLVYEGKVETDEGVIAILDEHGCTRRHGVADSGDDTLHVYQFCLRHGINAIKGGKEAFYSHGDEGRKIFSPERPLYQMVNGDPTCDNPIDEPQFWFYSKAGIRDRLGYLRASGAIAYDVPEDVSEDYSKHHEAEQQETKYDADGHPFTVWTQHADRNDLFVCEAYIAMQMEMAGLIGEVTYVQPINDETQRPTNASGAER